MSETLKLTFELLVIFELIFVEQYFITRILKKRCNLWGLVISDVVITLGIVLLIVFVLSKQAGYGDGGGRNLILGLFYIFPPIIFSKIRLKDLLIIIFSGFLYGLLVYALSVRIAYFFDTNYLAMFVFIIQTSLHIILFFVLRSIPLVKGIMNFEWFNEKVKTRLLIVVFLAFFLIVSFNSNLTRETNDFQRLLAIVMLIAFIVFSFIMIFELWKEVYQNENMTSEMMTDRLTRIKNRTAFLSDLNKAIKNGAPFSLLYIDLDNFKAINDNYGHLTGDSYLIAFAQTLFNNKEDYQSFYRISGDEFCCLTKNLKNTEQVLKSIQKIEYLLDDVAFLGFSYGVANYPTDFTTEADLITLADANMYKAKNSNKYVDVEKM